MRTSSGPTEERILAADVQPWTELPLWLPGSEHAGMARADISRALAAGLTFRPLEETIADTLAWDRTVPGDRPTLAPEKERGDPRPCVSVCRSGCASSASRSAAVYDRETIDAILDEALICHLGFEVEGQPYVIPTLHARVGDVLYVHGSAASRMLRHAAAGAPVCVTVTLLDGLVLARSVFNHSVNYRSGVVFGSGNARRGRGEARGAPRAHRAARARAAGTKRGSRRDTELKATWILSLPLDEASAKVRTGPAGGRAGGLDLPVWAGVVPVHLAAEPSEYDWRRVRDGRLGPPRRGG